MELTTARARTGCRAVFLIGILAIAGFIGGERTTGIACVLVLHTGLIGHHRIARGIEGLAVQEGIERGRTCPT
jgi:hypothetical protein